MPHWRHHIAASLDTARLKTHPAVAAFQQRRREQPGTKPGHLCTAGRNACDAKSRVCSGVVLHVHLQCDSMTCSRVGSGASHAVMFRNIV